MKRNKETSEMGKNRTGVSLNPREARKTYEGAQVEATKGTEKQVADAHIEFAAESYGIGSIPEGVPTTIGGRSLKNGPLGLLLDKLSERAAFERTGVRLYEAFLAKVAAGNGRSGPLLSEAREIRDQELEHFHLVTAEIRKLGGDETVMSPSADASSVASRGLMQVLTDPRTTLAQSMCALLSAELTDNAGWELLIKLSDGLGLSKSSEGFQRALEQEREHLQKVRRWIIDDLSSKLPMFSIEFEPAPLATRSRGPARRSSKSRLARSRK